MDTKQLQKTWDAAIPDFWKNISTKPRTKKTAFSRVSAFHLGFKTFIPSSLWMTKSKHLACSSLPHCLHGFHQFVQHHNEDDTANRHPSLAFLDHCSCLVQAGSHHMFL